MNYDPVPDAYRLISDSIVDRLANQIVSGELAPGERLNEVDLSERLDVSRSPLREALRRLKAEGLVISRPHKGTYVADFDVDEARDFYEFRVIVQTECALLAMPVLTDRDLAEMEAVLIEIENAVAQGDRFAYLSVVNGFHRVYEQRCPNREARRCIEGMALRASRFRVLSIAEPGRMEDSARRHRLLFEALKKRDPVGVRMACREIYSASGAAVVKAILEREASVREGSASLEASQ